MTAAGGIYLVHEPVGPILASYIGARARALGLLDERAATPEPGELLALFPRGEHGMFVNSEVHASHARTHSDTHRQTHTHTHTRCCR